MHQLPLLALLSLALVSSTAALPRSLLIEGKAKALPPQRRLQGAWSGTRQASAFITWDEATGMFDADCIRNNEATVMAIFGLEAVRNGTISYDSTLQVLETLGGRDEIQQDYTTPTDYIKDGGKTVLVAGINPFLGGYTGNVVNYTDRAIIYAVDALGKQTIGCLDWTLHVDKLNEAVTIKQVETFRVEINNGKFAVLYSNVCNEAAFDEPTCVVDVLPQMKNDTTLETKINGTQVDPFIYCIADTRVLDNEYESCFNVMAPAFSAAFDNLQDTKKLDNDHEAVLCQAWRNTDHKFTTEDYETCFKATRSVGSTLLNTETEAVSFCKEYVTCESCQFCNKYGYSCIACNINATALDTKANDALLGLGSFDSLSGVTVLPSGIFQSSDLETGDQMALDSWAPLVDKFTDLPRIRPDDGQVGIANISNPVKQWVGFLENVDLVKANLQGNVRAVQQSFENLYGGRFMDEKNEFEKKIITATVVTNYKCNAGACLDLLEP